ncbi:MAG: SDR family oxidoreductase [Pirellulales bacterium]
MERFVVLGATGSVGRALVKRLVERGDSVLMLGRSTEKLESLSRELSQPFQVIDVDDGSNVAAAISGYQMSDGSISGVANCIGSVLLKPVHLTSDADFREVVNVNLFSCFAVAKAAAAVMRESGGSVVFFASAAAEIGLQNHEAIASAKACVIGLARSAAASYAHWKIRFNVVSPGLVRSEMTRGIWSNPSAAAASEDMHALGRLGEPEDIASAAAFLLDPANDWITGQVLGVDGGLGSILPRRKVKPTSISAS